MREKIKRMIDETKNETKNETKDETKDEMTDVMIEEGTIVMTEDGMTEMTEGEMTVEGTIVTTGDEMIEEIGERMIVTTGDEMIEETDAMIGMITEGTTDGMTVMTEETKIEKRRPDLSGKIRIVRLLDGITLQRVLPPLHHLLDGIKHQQVKRHHLHVGTQLLLHKHLAGGIKPQQVEQLRVDGIKPQPQTLLHENVLVGTQLQQLLVLLVGIRHLLELLLEDGTRLLLVVLRLIHQKKKAHDGTKRQIHKEQGGQLLVV
jgi:hypothetical protein